MQGTLLGVVRERFRREGVEEVITPVLAPHGASDPHLVNLTVEDGGERLFLQTSPEYAMKKRIAAEGRSIYQICPAFRGGETGARHSREFTMLEWYRCGFSLEELMDDLEGLFAEVVAALPDARLGAGVRRLSYGELFADVYGVSPHEAALAELAALAAARGLKHLGQEARREDFLDGLFAVGVEPRLTEPTIVYDYPACQAVLACLKRDAEGERVADRFEFFAGGMEIANAYNELRDGGELGARFAENNRVREARGLPRIAADEELLEAVGRMPPTAGIALGLERLVMALGVEDSG